MGEPDQSGGVEEGLPKVFQNGDLPLHPVPAGGLHPGVRHEYPESRQVGSQKEEESGPPVPPGGDSVSPEEEDAEEDRFQEEGEDPFGRQEGTEKVPHRSGVLGPIGPEGKLQSDPRSGSDHEERPEKFDQEGVQLPLLLPAASQGESFDHKDHQAQPECSGRVEKVETCRQGKLQTGEKNGVHGYTPRFFRLKRCAKEPR